MLKENGQGSCRMNFFTGKNTYTEFHTVLPTVKKETKPPSLLQYLPKPRALFSLSWLGSFYSDVFYLVFLDRSSLCHQHPPCAVNTRHHSLTSQACTTRAIGTLAVHMSTTALLLGNLHFRSFLHLYL